MNIFSRTAQFSVIAISAGIFISAPVLAWDGGKTGKITGLDAVADGQNYGFRVYVDGSSMCGTSENWAFINANASNYNAVVSLLTTAYLSNKTVEIYTNKNGIYCEIGYVRMH